MLSHPFQISYAWFPSVRFCMTILGAAEHQQSLGVCDGRSRIWSAVSQSFSTWVSDPIPLPDLVIVSPTPPWSVRKCTCVLVLISSWTNECSTVILDHDPGWGLGIWLILARFLVGWIAPDFSPCYCLVTWSTTDERSRSLSLSADPVVSHRLSSYLWASGSRQMLGWYDEGRASQRLV